jgi:hypothetical protein
MKGPMHGLPMDYKGDLQDFAEALGYLQAIVKSKRPMLVEAGNETRSVFFLAVRGRLHSHGLFSSALGEPEGHLFQIGEKLPPDPYLENPYNYFMVHESRFGGGVLETLDGDDYVVVLVRMDSTILRVMDTNAQ